MVKIKRHLPILVIFVLILIIIKVARDNNNYGSLADWVGGIGTVCAIFYTNKQIAEQRKEFNESKEIRLRIGYKVEPVMTPIGNGERKPNGHILHIFASNIGLAPTSLKFIGLCEEKYLSNLIGDDTVTYDPEYGNMRIFLQDDKVKIHFKLIQPGQVCEEIPYNIEKYLDSAQPKGNIHAIYLDAAGEYHTQIIDLNKKSNNKPITVNR